jgi:cytoskeletal protein RodZ
MKKMLLTTALAVVASCAWGQTLRQPLMKTQDVPKPQQQTTSTTSTTTTEDTGTITQYTPGSAIVLRETSGPVSYRFGKTVTYVTRSGKVLDANTVKTRVKVGVPVRVHYVGTGQNKVVDRVVLEHD